MDTSRLTYGRVPKPIQSHENRTGFQNDHFNPFLMECPYYLCLSFRLKSVDVSLHAVLADIVELVSAWAGR